MNVCVTAAYTLAALVSLLLGIKRIGRTFIYLVKVTHLLVLQGAPNYSDTHIKLLTQLDLRHDKTINIYRKSRASPSGV